MKSLLPPRVYERFGVRDYSIGHKQADGRWAFRLRCAVADLDQIALLRAQACARVAGQPAPAVRIETVAQLAHAWFAYHTAMPSGAEGRRAASTLAENRREARSLVTAFGLRRVDSLRKPDAYAYLDDCVLRGRPGKGNKEIALLRLMLEFGVRRGVIEANPFDRVQQLPTARTDRLVTDAELALALDVGRMLGGPRLIVALALNVAWLCLRRSVEVRSLTRSQLTADGILWQAAKRQKGQAQRSGLIEWSTTLRALVDEALNVPRAVSGSWYVFGNLQGQPYTKGGWSTVLAGLMRECQREAGRRCQPFTPFSLQDCRPKGVSDKMAAGASDVMDATMHSNQRMIQQVYDRRRLRVAKPVK
jgi:integrase